MKRIIFAVMLMHCSPAAADAPALTPLRQFYISNLIKAVEAARNCAVALDLPVINAWARNQGLYPIENIPNLYPDAFFRVAFEHVRLMQELRRKEGEPIVCLYLVGSLDITPDWAGWRKQEDQPGSNNDAAAKYLDEIYRSLDRPPPK